MKLSKTMDSGRTAVRSLARSVAKLLNSLSGGRLSPNSVTLFGFVMHIPIALLIARGYFIYGGIGLIIFGLFDTLDGELARLQERPSAWGMFLDSITDRMKEVLLYVAAAYFFVWSSQPFWAVWAVAACGAGLLVSYVNAWGEVVTKNLASDQAVNKKFRGGIMSFDIRMLVLIIGLLTNYLPAAVVILALLSWQTALTRMLNIRRRLQHAKS